ncbi:hypothetical protein BpHYR1_044651 [Brachionus plicatilis]|uniref:Uncharacterized protein n=1 Tax=Brachionus plicatilis TaxID=10195 RepID=A0A3M7T6F0_BRAPC|nr:hypothetical protein BpHYR1_044651 [Brachionus plicatilis]
MLQDSGFYVNGIFGKDQFIYTENLVNAPSNFFLCKFEEWMLFDESKQQSIDQNKESSLEYDIHFSLYN